MSEEKSCIKCGEPLTCMHLKGSCLKCVDKEIAKSVKVCDKYCLACLFDGTVRLTKQSTDDIIQLTCDTIDVAKRHARLSISPIPTAKNMRKLFKVYKEYYDKQEVLIHWENKVLGEIHKVGKIVDTKMTN